MIKEIRIRNFKGIDELWLNLCDLNVLIGANSAGKSTIIQAIDILLNSVDRDITEYLSDRGWKVDEIKSQVSKNRRLSFDALLTFIIDGQMRNIVWRIAFLLTQKDNSITLESEQFSIVSIHYNEAGLKEHINALDSSPMSNLVYRYQKGVFVMTNEQGLRQDYPLNLSIPSSIMKIIRTFPDIGQLEFINTFQAFVQNSQSLETLSTEKMRRSSRGKTSGIGSKGERLAAFIKQMDSEQKVRFYNNLKPFIPSLNSLETVVKGKPGWIELFLDESWGDNTLKVKSSHISDGFLRIIAFVSLLELDARPGLIVFDEVEDGINPHIASEIVKLLYRYSQAHNRQLVVTTHSSLMLDEFDPSNIIYVYRQVNGAIMAQHIFQRQDVKHMLEYMNPGEIWINTSEQELVGSKQTRS